MPDRVLFISWGSPVRGREARALQVFQELVAHYDGMRTSRAVERVSAVMLEPHGDIHGYIELSGSAAQIAAVREDLEHRRLIMAARGLVERLRVVEGHSDESLREQIELFRAMVLEGGDDEDEFIPTTAGGR